MKPEDFKRWRKEMGFTQKQAAEALDISIQTLGNYERGTRYEDGREVSIPKSIALACSAIQQNLIPYPQYERVMDRRLRLMSGDIYLNMVEQNFLNENINLDRICTKIKRLHSNTFDDLYGHDVKLELHNNSKNYAELCEPLIEAANNKDQERFMSLFCDFLDKVKENIS
ncbi:helix-turn-helix domain-containing protein [Bartonella tamiae]|uniref:HTH cro/C1-type domain-containing protein n=1 Tax=Bartonella tamiae Th239 TaxID=1094558 RepID=J1K3G3_9HYPH|nr:helix-turn-helix transcriptional regulator [Bartonella tamiae]EJF91670.1 hypothetical protein ME5_00049 [Bartonella tamiae Th239]